MLAWGDGEDRSKRIEFKGAGRQVVAAPSVGLGGPYVAVGAGLEVLELFTPPELARVLDACRALDLTPPPPSRRQSVKIKRGHEWTRWL